MAQRFIARERYEFPNGAIGWRPGGPMDCLGPYAKVQHCPIKVSGAEIDYIADCTGDKVFVDTRVYLAKRYTCYASGYADTFFSVPANTRIGGRHVGGFFSLNDGAVEFIGYKLAL